jgi:hypothetical protein
MIGFVKMFGAVKCSSNHSKTKTKKQGLYAAMIGKGYGASQPQLNLQFGDYFISPICFTISQKCPGHPNMA